MGLYADPQAAPKPSAVVILRPAQNKTLLRVQEILKPLLDAAGESVDTSAQCAGSATWVTKEKAFITMHAGWMVAAQQRDLLDRTLIEAARRSGQLALARGLEAERAALRPAGAGRGAFPVRAPIAAAGVQAG